MAPETKEISLDMRTITELHKEGKSFQEIGKILKLSFTTVDYIVKKYLETGSVENKSRPGGPSKVTSVAKRMIVRTAMAASDVVQSGRPIFDDFFQHLWPYIGNNTANVVFQMVKRLWLIRIDQ
ncbi:paired domain-containing protein [Trichonephila clavipes]|nr:paired domain-containing protein [Trichonephila clavipes]